MSIDVSIGNLHILRKVSVYVCISDLHVTQVSVLSVYVRVCIREVRIAAVSA